MQNIRKQQLLVLLLVIEPNFKNAGYLRQIVVVGFTQQSRNRAIDMRAV